MAARRPPAKKSAAPSRAAKVPSSKTAPAKPPTARDKLDAAGTEWVVEQIYEGASHRAICARLGVRMRDLWAWIRADESRHRACAHAREAAALAFEEMADEVLVGVLEQVHPDALGVARERAAHFRWRARVASPRTHGDRQILAGDPEAPVEVKSTLTPAEAYMALIRGVAAPVRKLDGET